MYKISALIMISCLFSQSYFSSLNQFINVNKNCQFIKTYKSPNYKLVSTLPQENIKLFAKSSLNGDTYDNFLLSIKGKTAFFKWKSETSMSFSPELIISDINNDKAEELIIILTTGSGSDIHIEAVHIVDMITLSEYSIDNPLLFIKDKVKTDITSKESYMLIQVKLNDKEYTIRKDKNYAGIWFENVVFGNSIHWKVIDNKLFAYIDAQVSPSGYIGTLTIQYKFENNTFKPDKISFDEAK